MLKLDEPQFHKNHSLVRGITESVYCFETLSPAKVYTHMGELQYLKKRYAEQDAGGISELCEEVQERLARASKTSHRFAISDREELIAVCDQLRLRIMLTALSVAAISARLDGENEEILQAVIDDDAQSLCGPITRGKGSVTHAVVGGARVVLLPLIRCERQCDEINEEFLTILEHSPDIESWIIDFSLLDELPGLLLANLIVYAEKLRIAGDDLHLCWVRPSFFSELQLPRVINFFGLRKVGGFYFSDT